MNHAGRAADALPRAKLDVHPLAALVLEEGRQIALQHEEDFFHFMGMGCVALARLDIHDAEGEVAGWNGRRVAVFTRSPGPDEAVLSPLVALDPRIGEGVPVGLTVTE